MITHTLEKEKHHDFLAQNRIDPITGDVLQEGDQIVICASCKSAFLVDSWSYMDNKHCNQTYTLREIPKQTIVKIDRESINERLDKLAFFRFITVKESEVVGVYGGGAALTGGIILYSGYLFNSFSLIFLGILSIIIGYLMAKILNKQKYLILDSGYFIINQGQSGEVVIPKEEIKTVKVERAIFFSRLANSFLFNKKEEFYYLILTTKNNTQHKVFISENEVSRIRTETNILTKYATPNHSSIPAINAPPTLNAPNGRIDFR